MSRTKHKKQNKKNNKTEGAYLSRKKMVDYIIPNIN